MALRVLVRDNRRRVDVHDNLRLDSGGAKRSQDVLRNPQALFVVELPIIRLTPQRAG